MILFGPAGVGKSTANFQACAEWGAGLPAFHIKPARPLRIVMVQTEDSLDDLRECRAGVFESTVFGSAEIKLVRQNLIILPPIAGCDPVKLALLLDAAAGKHKPDLIAVNPLLAFVPDDPAREIGRLLYHHIDPVIKRHQIGFLGTHHTPKMNNRDTTGYGAFDHQYLAAGDARVANWPRGMLLIEPMANGVFRFRCVKRWRRIGWQLNGEPVQERSFRYADRAIRWVDATPEEATRAAKVEDYRRILEVLPKADEKPVSRERIRDEARNKLNVGRDRADAWLKLAYEDGLAEKVSVPGEGTRSSMMYRARTSPP